MRHPSLAALMCDCFNARTLGARASSATHIIAITLVGLAIHGCATSHPSSAVPAAVPATQAGDKSGATVYAVDSAESEVDILVYRGGALGRLGHNHVMTAKKLTGQAWIHPQFEKSGFDISFQVNDLIVDDAQARSAAGAEFPPDIPQADRDATRTNMLKPEVLDGERFPEVRVQATSVHGDVHAARLVAGISIKDVRREIAIPISLSVEASRLVAQGEFDILQSDFGIKPFSAGLGMLQVQDRLHLRFRIVARR